MILLVLSIFHCILNVGVYVRRFLMSDMIESICLFVYLLCVCNAIIINININININEVKQIIICWIVKSNFSIIIHLEDDGRFYRSGSIYWTRRSCVLQRHSISPRWKYIIWDVTTGFEIIMHRKTIHLTSFFFGMLTCIFLYFAIYLPYYKKVEAEWEDYCPVRIWMEIWYVGSSISYDNCHGSIYSIVGCVLFVQCRLTITLWKVWGFLTVPILMLAFSCGVNFISHFYSICFNQT